MILENLDIDDKEGSSVIQFQSSSLLRSSFGHAAHILSGSGDRSGADQEPSKAVAKFSFSRAANPCRLV